MPSKGKTVERGYGAQHKQLRAQIKRDIVDPGLAHCWRCGGWINPTEPWDLGHDDQDRTIYRGPEHARTAHCSAGGNRATNGRKKSPPRRWEL